MTSQFPVAVLLCVAVATAVMMCSAIATGARPSPSQSQASRFATVKTRRLAEASTNVDGAQSSLRPSRQPSGSKIEWLHVPKTGTTFGTTLLLWACPELAPAQWMGVLGLNASLGDLPASCLSRLRTDPASLNVLGNWLFGDHVSLENRTDAELGRVFTMLRSPRTRIPSGYHMLWDERGHNHTEQQICEWARGPASIVHTALSAQVRMVVGARVSYRGNKTAGGMHWFDDPAPPGPEAAEEACRRVRLFAFVGLAEHWEASVCLFHAMHGGQAHAVELQNVRRGGYSAVPGTVKEADCGDTADERLYGCARELFLARLQQHPQCIQHLVPAV